LLKDAVHFKVKVRKAHVMDQKSILLIDNDPIIREIIRDALDGHYAVFEASCYSEAIKFSNQHIDLALIDYVLPDSDGFETLQALRKEIPALPVIIMTANGSERVALKAIRSEVTDYINKPLKLSYLKLRISEIVGQGTNRRQHEYSGEKNNREGFILDGIPAYIEENYMKPLTLDMLARKVSMNKFRFCKAFKEQVGQTFISYLNNIRIRNATGFLRNDDLNITEIAYVVGYKNVVHFDRVFKDIHGVPPREYRKNFKNTKGPASERPLLQSGNI
jgi:YesN/AraC family two-component response regulator